MKLPRGRLLLIFISVLYFAVHLPGLISLPVFSDEAIYIRWAQVAFHEPEKYAFLPMLDGKPPLHVWSLIPFLQVFEDPLLAGRLVSVMAGLFTMYVFGLLVKELGGSEDDRFLGMIIVLITPFWFFHHRMALAEAELGLVFALGLLFGLRMMRKFHWKDFIGFALSFGLALWIKTTALFFIPVYALIPLLCIAFEKQSLQLKDVVQIYWNRRIVGLAVSGMIGIVLFLLLRLSPLFPSLFTRSADYTFSFTQIMDGEWRYVLLESLPRTMVWIIWYMSPFLLFASFYGKKRNLVLFLMSVVYAAPLLIMGRVLSARYFFPLATPLSLMGLFGIKELMKQNKKGMLIKLAIMYVFHVVSFMSFAIFQPAKIPLTHEDATQYLREWSSGYGIPEATKFFSEKIKDKKITVGTEGFFGTLPDGLQIYFDRNPNHENIEIIGVGQPLHTIPDKLLESAKKQETFLLVNQHRFFLKTEGEHLQFTVIARYPRPLQGPDLLLLQIL